MPVRYVAENTWEPSNGRALCKLVLTVNQVLLCIALGLGLHASAQVTNIGDTTSTPVPGAGHDYIHLLSETVNPANGSVSLRIEFPVPKGRGITVPFSIDYDSNSGLHLEGDPVVPGHVIWDRSSQIGGMVLATGWSYGMPSLSFIHYESVVGPQFVMPQGSIMPPSTSYINCANYTNYMFTDINGGQHPLYVGTSYYDNNNNDGNNSHFTCTYGRGQGGGDTQVLGVLPNSANDVYDPSAMAEFPVKVYTPDGTVYTFSGAEWGANAMIEDRNGNIENIVDNQNNGIQNISVQDTAGRPVISFSLGGTGTQQQFTVGGLVYTVTFAAVSTNASLPEVMIGGAGQFNGQSAVGCDPIPAMNFTNNVISQISLPNGQSYKFQYGTNNSDPNFQNPYGLLNEIDYPSGAWVKYGWGTSSSYNELLNVPGVNYMSGAYCSQFIQGCPVPVPDGCLYQYSTPVVVTREVGFTSGGAAQQTQTFSYSTSWGAWGTSAATAWTQKTTQAATADNARGLTATTSYIYSPYSIPSNDPLSSPPQYPQQVPVENQITYKDYGSATLETVTKTWLNQYQLQSVQTTPGSGTATKVNYNYASNYPFSLVGEEDEYDYGALSPTRITNTTYQTFSSTPGYLANMPSSVVTCSGGSSCSATSTNRAAEVDYSYDGGTIQPASALPTGTHDSAFSPSSTTPRGNVTLITEQCWTNCANAVSNFTYDETGQVATATDARGFQTQYSFADSPSGGNSYGNSNAYITQIISPPTNGVTHERDFTYNYHTGELASSKDENGLTTAYCYMTGGCSGNSIDPLNRLTEVDYPDSGKTNISYSDSVPNPSVTTTRLQTPYPTATSVSIMDGMGHVIQKQSSDPNGSDVVTTTYDGLGHIYTQTNPSLSSSSPSGTFNNATAPQTTYQYDALGRTTSKQNPDNSSQTIRYNANSVTVTDEDSNQWMRTSDAFGRLTKVFEPNGTSRSPSMETDYSYDALGNLLQVNQQGTGIGAVARVRTFNYDPLSRLITASNPETGTICYGTRNGSNCVNGYDANGNLLIKTDPRGVATNYFYDALNRVSYKWYTSGGGGSLYPGSPYSCYLYDTATNGIGRLAAEWTQAGSCSASVPQPVSSSNVSGYQSLRVFSAYDPVGRLTSEQQCAQGFCTSPQPPPAPTSNCASLQSANGLTYCYDLAGNLTAYSNGVAASTITPPAILFSQQFDTAGRLSTVGSSWSDAQHPSPLFSVNETGTPSGYSAASSLQNWMLGANLNLIRSYDPRLRIAGQTSTVP